MRTVALLSVCHAEYTHENDAGDQLRNSRPYVNVARAKEQARVDANQGTLVWHDEPDGESWTEDKNGNVWLVTIAE